MGQMVQQLQIISILEMMCVHECVKIWNRHVVACCYYSRRGLLIFRFILWCIHNTKKSMEIVKSDKNLQKKIAQKSPKM